MNWFFEINVLKSIEYGFFWLSVTLKWQGWVQEMASFVKSMDKNHLLEIGMEGFYGDSMPEKKVNNPDYQVGTDCISNNLIKETFYHHTCRSWYLVLQFITLILLFSLTKNPKKFRLYVNNMPNK